MISEASEDGDKFEDVRGECLNRVQATNTELSSVPTWTHHNYTLSSFARS